MRWATEVVRADNAELLYAGISADDPYFMISAWTAECTWCQVDPRVEQRPSFGGMAITVDGFKSVTADRPAAEPRRWFECLSGEDRLTWWALDVAATTAYEWGRRGRARRT